MTTSSRYTAHTRHTDMLSTINRAAAPVRLHGQSQTHTVHTLHTYTVTSKHPTEIRAIFTIPIHQHCDAFAVRQSSRNTRLFQPISAQIFSRTPHLKHTKICNISLSHKNSKNRKHCQTRYDTPYMSTRTYQSHAARQTTGNLCLHSAATFRLPIMITRLSCKKVK